jgi:error-prone DNA polymerase
MSESLIEYVELHCHSNYSFQEGASSIRELVGHALDLGYSTLALTDHDNLCGAMEFAQKASLAGLRAITGSEMSIAHPNGAMATGAGGGIPTHLTLLAASPAGYSNLSRLMSFAYVFGDRRDPQLDPGLLPKHAEGIIALSGCSIGAIPQALIAGRTQEAATLARQYVEWFGEGNFYLELQQNLVHGDTQRNRRLATLGRELGIPVVATNNVHYHVKERHRLQDCLVAIRHRKTLENSHRERRANAEFYLKSPGQMAKLFQDLPEAICNTLGIAERCEFDLTSGLTYRFPSYPVPDGFDGEMAYLKHLCYEAGKRKYGSLTQQVQERLAEEFRIIEKRDLGGFFLIYHEIITMAREVQVELGLVNPETPLEEAPPGRGRGSSVAMLVGYLTGLSHIDPLMYNLSLERFLPDESGLAPDIDLDFPRNIRERLITRVHERWGWDHAALTGMISTYQIRGAVRDLGMVLGLPGDEVDQLAKQVERATASQVGEEMLALPAFSSKTERPGWRGLIDLSAQLDGFPRNMAQHPGGMIISSTPLIDQVPVQQSAIEGRYVCHWDKDSIDDAGFVKIDFLALGALSQMQEAVRLIEERTGEPLDLSRIDFEDEEVYDMLAQADTIGIFQVESAAQIQTISRIRPKNLVDMAFEVAAVRPGVGANDGVSEFIRRRNMRQVNPEAPIPYDHPLEQRALERTLGVILFQDQMNQMAIDVGGFSAKDADKMRRAYLKRNDIQAIEEYWWPRFRDGAHERGVDEATTARIFRKFNGQYMFPEAHAFAFGVTAYQMSWLKHYHPLEFFVGLFNEQPMGFYNLETLKEDSKRHGVRVLHPDVNFSSAHSVIECKPLVGDQPRKEVIKHDALRLGLMNVRGISAAAEGIVAEREANGAYTSVADFMARTGLQREALDNLTDAGALRSWPPFGLGLTPSDRTAADKQEPDNRRSTRWEVGLRYRPVGRQLGLQLPVEQDMVELPEASAWEVMRHEYRTMGIHPDSHLMAHLREQLEGIVTSADIWELLDGTPVRVAGLVVRRQRPLGKTVFISLEDEFGHTPIVIWPQVYTAYRHVLKEPMLIITGTVSHREGTMSVVVSHVEVIPSLRPSLGSDAPKSKNWG